MIERGRGVVAQRRPLSADDIRSVDAFRDWMIQKLDENTHKGNRAAWIDPERFSSEDALERLFEEVLELQRAVHRGDSAEAVIREAADVGNIAMMIADQTGELRTLRPPRSAAR